MTVVYVDLEHEQVLLDPARAPAHAVKLEAARSCLEAAAREPCRVIRYSEVALPALDRLVPSSVVVSGMMTDWAGFDFRSLEGLLEVIRRAATPILGICAGQQLIGHAHGARWGPLGPLQEGEPDPDPRFVPGERKERGFLPLQIDHACPLFAGLTDHPRFFQTHYWQLQDVPAGFVARASSAWSPIQVIERLDRRVFGVQFHPERSDAGHPDGHTLLRNFFALASR